METRALARLPRAAVREGGWGSRLTLAGSHGPGKVLVSSWEKEEPGRPSPLWPLHTAVAQGNLPPTPTPRLFFTAVGW